MTARKKLFTLALCCAAIAGCQNLKKTPVGFNNTSAIANSTQAENLKRLQALGNWEISAKVSVERRGEHFSTAFLNWVEKDDNYQIDITSPMGVGHLQITKNGDTITATTTQAEGGSQHYQVNNLDELVNKLSGLALPVSQLRYWIKGMPDPNQRHHDARYDANNNLVSVHQQDWNLEWDRFKTQQGLQLPHKIKATQLKGGSLKVTLIIAQWQL